MGYLWVTRLGRISIIALIIILPHFARVTKNISSNEGGDTARLKTISSLSTSTDPPELAEGENFATTAKKCVGGRKFADIVRYSKSQRKEDLHVMKWFGNLCNGTYIEMGALNGVLGSNSIVFNKSELHWRGVLIELIKENYDELVVNRPDEIATIHSCVCGKKQMLHTVAQSRVNRLVSQGSTGGIFEFAAPSFRQHWWGGNTLDEIRASDRVGYVSEVDCDTLDNLLLEHAENVTFFDFFSLDVEGAELEILKSVDFNRVGFGIIFAEADNHNTTKNLEIKTLLESEGYHFWGDMLGSYWFLNSDFFDIYKGLL